jgi:hypothetical protein
MALIETTMFKVHNILNMNMVHESIEENLNGQKYPQPIYLLKMKMSLAYTLHNLVVL